MGLGKYMENTGITKKNHLKVDCFHN